MEKVTMCITSAPIVPMTENGISAGVLTHLLSSGVKANYKVTVVLDREGDMKITGDKVIINQTKRVNLSIETDSDEAITAFRQAARVCGDYYKTKYPTTYKVKVMGEEMQERWEERWSDLPKTYDLDEFFGDDDSDDNTDDDTDADGGEEDLPFEGDDTEDDETDEIEREMNAERYRQERREDINNYYYDRI